MIHCSESQLYWCEECKIPLYEPVCGCCGAKGRQFVKDVRVVFPEEKVLLEILLGLKAGELKDKSLWNAAGNVYYLDGVRMPLSIQQLREMDAAEIRKSYDKNRETMDGTFFKQMIERFVKANANRYQEISQEALSYIWNETQGIEIGDMFVSFSGGKDSTVVADLCKRALDGPGKKILHIFGDTTLEFPMTEEYVAQYKKENPKTPMISSRNKEKDFEELCGIVGPPSRVMRWCCTIFKTGAINQKISALFRGKKRIVAFQGIRHSESASRSKYERTSTNSKIAKQLTLCPIIEWFDFDVWLYLMTTGISFNSAYRLGYARVGCYCCPNNSLWSEFLSSIFIPEKYNDFQNLLIDFAKKVGKKDAEVYVKEGKWKARQGGNGLDYARKSIVSYEPCVKEENAFHYDLTRPVTEELYELFKPFGTYQPELGNKRLGEACFTDADNNIVLVLQGRQGQNRCKVIIHNESAFHVKGISKVREKIDCQITKYQMCMGCKACESVCRFNAISVREKPDKSTSYTINEAKCVKCTECVSHFSVGCYMRKVLTIKREDKEGTTNA
ncbi:phosphoadenosine phosphosulfate reductase family protein [Roseburia sp. CAG:309]|nr:phosphoadenosine phosphosulfate reductase family protein [Roseburia sp. CAG:309]